MTEPWPTGTAIIDATKEHRIMIARFLTGLAAAALAGHAALAQPTCPMTYEAFEFAIPHINLEKCPADLHREGVFCRATVGNDGVHVFAFAPEGDHCLIRLKSYKEDEFELTVK
jgi:hypothetical protein